jgi:hypothetical protein
VTEGRPRRRREQTWAPATAVEGPRRGAVLAQTAWIGDPAAPPPLASAAESGVRAGRYGPHRDCNHIDLPLGTGPTPKGGTAGLPKRTRYVVA